MVTNKIRHWLVFFRAHTGSLEAPIAGLGAAAALGSVFEPEVVLWALVGLLYHYAGYGQNSYYDWKNGFDKDDPHKQHHPLNTGAISPRIADLAANGAVVSYLAVTLWLVRSSLLAISIALGAFVCGIVYNLLGKKFTHKYIFISISHSSLFIIPYALYSAIDLFAVLILTALILQHIFQIAISGDIKDIGQDESSLLDSIGIECYKIGVFSKDSQEYKSKGFNIRCSMKAVVIVILLTLLQGSLSLYAVKKAALVVTIQEQLAALILIFIGIFSLLMLSGHIVKTGEYNREKRLRYISLREVVGFWTIYAALIPTIGLIGYVIALILSVCYVIIHSKFMWGTLIRPQV